MHKEEKGNSKSKRPQIKGRTGQEKQPKKIRTSEEKEINEKPVSSVSAGRAAAAEEEEAAQSPNCCCVAAFGSQAQNQYCCSSLALAATSHPKTGPASPPTNSTHKRDGILFSAAKSR